MLTCEGKIAIVTGATGGIGMASAKKLAEEGATVYALVRRVEAMEDIIRGWGDLGPGRVAKAIYFDAGNIDTIAPAIEAVYAEAGRIDIFVNNAIAAQNAAVTDNTTVVETSHETLMGLYEGIMGVSAACARAAIPLMIQGGGGSFVNISSTTSVQADMTRSFYGISKAAVNLFTKDIAMQYGRQGIRCNAVLPGFTVGASTLDVLPKEFVEQWLKHAPLRRLGKPEDQANAVAFFAGNQSEWVTGQILEVCGGFGVGSPIYGDTVEPCC